MARVYEYDATQKHVPNGIILLNGKTIGHYLCSSCSGINNFSSSERV